MVSPKPFPADVPNEEFESLVKRHFSNKIPAPSRPFDCLITAGPPGTGKSFFIHTIAQEPVYQNHVLFDGNEEILCQLSTYQQDITQGMSLPDAWTKYVPTAAYFEALLLTAATGVSDERIKEIFDLNSKQFKILRRYVERKPYDMLICSTLRDGYECDEIWNKITDQGYRRTLCVFLGAFSDCQKRSAPANRGGWIRDVQEKSKIRFNVPAGITERASYHQDCIDAALQHIKQTNPADTVKVFALPRGKKIPRLIAEKNPPRPFRILNKLMWNRFPSRPNRKSRLFQIV